MGEHIAFGVEPGRRAPFELRQARYHRLAEVIEAEVARVEKARGGPVDILDVGTSEGRMLRYLEPRIQPDSVTLTGVDLYPFGKERVYRRDDWRLLDMDLEEGMPELPSEEYDIVVCEQVLEHLHHPQRLLADIERVLRPGGLAIIGVPIFPFGLHRLRPAAVRAIAYFGGKAKRDHVREWSLRTFLADLRRLTGLEVVESRGFRIVSGGPLRFLEFHRRWWRLNRWLGARLPGLCVEAQVLLRKRRADRGSASR